MQKIRKVKCIFNINISLAIIPDLVEATIINCNSFMHTIVKHNGTKSNIKQNAILIIIYELTGTVVTVDIKLRI